MRSCAAIEGVNHASILPKHALHGVSQCVRVVISAGGGGVAAVEAATANRVQRSAGTHAHAPHHGVRSHDGVAHQMIIAVCLAAESLLLQIRFDMNVYCVLAIQQATRYISCQHQIRYLDGRPKKHPLWPPI